jgi:hypothetical protein
MRKVIERKTIWSYNSSIRTALEYVDQKVMEHLNRGYETHGSLVLSPKGTSRIVAAQVMVKYAEDENL